MLQKQFDELKLTGCLPSPTGVGLSVLHQTQTDDYTLADLSRTLAADPTLTGRILRLANSSLNSGVEVARTAHQAAVRLGARTVRNVALGFTLVSGHRAGSCRNFDYEFYWSHSLAIAVAGQVLATRVPRLVPSEAFTFGLLSGIGRLALASIHPEAYAGILQQVQDGDGVRLSKLEREAFGLSHGELGAALFQDWHLPADYVQGVLVCTEAPSDDELEPTTARLVMVFHAARALADALMTTESDSVALCRARNERLAALRSTFALDLEEFEVLWAQVAADWREWGKIMDIEATTTTTPSRLVHLAARSEGVFKGELEGEPLASPSTVTPEPAAAVPAATPARVRASASTAMRVLVVEDDPVSRKLIAAHLAKEGHQVFCAVDGEEGLKLAIEHYPHLVVTDWLMPGMSGIDLVRALRRSDEGQHMQIIVLTGREEDARIIEAFDAGTDEYLAKPLNPRILLARVRSAQRVVSLHEQITRDAVARNSQLAELSVLNRKLQLAALTDFLTGLPNRRHAIERLQAELTLALRDGTPLSVIMIDIDKFKTVNDEHGHDTGDAVLCEVGATLRACIRSTELVCRIGGEEFLVICPRANAAKAALIAERMRLASESHRIRHGAFEGAITLSLGVAELDRTAPSVDRLIKLADERVYQAKQAGRNRVATNLSSTEIRAAS